MRIVTSVRFLETFVHEKIQLLCLICVHNSDIKLNIMFARVSRNENVYRHYSKNPKILHSLVNFSNSVRVYQKWIMFYIDALIKIHIFRQREYISIPIFINQRNTNITYHPEFEGKKIIISTCLNTHTHTDI